MDSTTVSGSGKLPSEGVNAPRKKKLSLSWWRQQKKALLPEPSKCNSNLDDSVCTNDSMHVPGLAGGTLRPSACSNLQINNRNKNISSNNNISSDTLSDLWSFYNNRKKHVADNSAQPMRKKLKPETVVNEICSRDRNKFICRFSCQDKFGSQSLRQEHEKLCWLKLPYGSIWTCEYCGVQIMLLSYSCVVCHEGKCNPFSTLQSGIYVQQPSESIPLMKNIKNISKDAPICCCAFQPTYCATSVSKSERNPGRKYFRCSKFNVDDRCRFFQWVKDENNY